MPINFMQSLSLLAYIPTIAGIVLAVQNAEAVHGAGAGPAKLAAATTIIQQLQAAGMLDKIAGGNVAKSQAIVNDVVQLLNDLGAFPSK